MKKLLLVALLIVGCGKNQNDIIYHFMNLNNGINNLTNHDEFTNTWSKFDIDVRLKQSNGEKNELFHFISKQVLEWSNSEKKILDSVMQLINKDIKSLKLQIDYPDTIFFIKTTGEEEGNAAGYTRSKCIILSENTLLLEFQELKNLVIHELFHILSRYNLRFRKIMYEIIDFKLIEEIEYPMSLIDFKITNPDAPSINSYINLSNDVIDDDYVLITYSESNYNKGGIFDYLQFGFIKLKDLKTSVKTPIIYSENDFTNFYEKIGKNTNYIIHADEILADNFVFLLNNRINLPSQWVVDKMKNKLQ